MTTSTRINRDASYDLAVIGVRLLDDAHMTWVAAEVESEDALRAWRNGAPADHAAAYLVYRAAADREEAAARDLERLCELTRPYQKRLARSH
jgi:FAD/FMN-containing dehydrogenase